MTNKKFYDKLRKKYELKPKYNITQSMNVPVYSFNLDAEINSDLISAEVKKLNLSVNHKPELVKKGYQSEYLSRSTYPQFEPLLDVVESKINLLSNKQYKIIHYWYIIYGKNGEQMWHHHGGADLSAVYYPQGTVSSPIQFKNYESVIDIETKKNTLLVFSSNALHKVATSNSDEERIVFSFNLEIDSIHK
jgi:hypothetical protein